MIGAFAVSDLAPSLARGKWPAADRYDVNVGLDLLTEGLASNNTPARHFFSHLEMRHLLREPDLPIATNGQVAPQSPSESVCRCNWKGANPSVPCGLKTTARPPHEA